MLTYFLLLLFLHDPQNCNFAIFDVICFKFGLWVSCYIYMPTEVRKRSNLNLPDRPPQTKLLVRLWLALDCGSLLGSYLTSSRHFSKFGPWPEKWGPRAPWVRGKKMGQIGKKIWPIFWISKNASMRLNNFVVGAYRAKQAKFRPLVWSGRAFWQF